MGRTKRYLTRKQAFWGHVLLFLGFVVTLATGAALIRWFQALEPWIQIIIGFGGACGLIAALDLGLWYVRKRMAP